jgi:hypothetical protein
VWSCFELLLSPVLEVSHLGAESRFGEPVSYFPLPGLKEFFLIASFGRCKFKLSEDSVGVLLQATLGGVAADFRAQQISDRVFKFVLASKNVGLHVYNLKVYSCDQYKIFFHLYGNGGANWVSEYKKYVSEEAAEWTFVSGDHLKSYHLNSDDNCLSGANRISLGARSKISFQNPKPSHLHSQLGVLKNFQNPAPMPRLSTVFQRLRWPEKILNSHIASSRNSDFNRRVMNLQWRRKEPDSSVHYAEFTSELLRKMVRGKKSKIEVDPRSNVCPICI